MNWRLAKSLETLRRQLDEKYPNRSKASDGTIGDAAHSSTISQHNPNKSGVVTAFDITHDPANGVHGGDLAELLNDDPRCWYVIWSKKIWDRKWIPYNGRNPHDRHVHISVKQTASVYDNANKWGLEMELKKDRDFWFAEAQRVKGLLDGLQKDRDFWFKEGQRLKKVVEQIQKVIQGR